MNHIQAVIGVFIAALTAWLGFFLVGALVGYIQGLFGLI